MTAAEWVKHILACDSGPAYTGNEEDILADLEKAEERIAALEEAALHDSYSPSWEDKYWDAAKFYEDAAQELHECQCERDDLRRKLEEVEHDRDEWRKQAGIQLTGTASLALANAALRGALEGIMPFADDATKTAWDRATAALAFSADGLVEEVMWLLTHNPAHVGTNIAEWNRWECRRDALLARMGGKI